MKYFLCFILFVCFSKTIISCQWAQASSYKIINEFYSSSIDSKVVELIHKKSGARLVLIKNQDLATSFTISFKTPPYDNTGLFHVFEHSVLDGSRMYPSKSNFLRINTASVGSFINALTGSDFTMYPFVTRNSQDFNNLLSVYMDAVFFPKVITDPKIMQREGWHYKFDSKTKKLSIEGTVFSEMQGVFNNPLRWIYKDLNKLLLPQTPYKYTNGGIPEDIATLRFEQLVQAHKIYYHPQNSTITLYGDLDYTKTLNTIDKQFLKEFTKKDKSHVPTIAKQVSFKKITSPYLRSTYPGLNTPDSSFLSKAYLLDSLTLLEEQALQIMMRAFVINDGSSLNMQTLNLGLAKSIIYDPFLQGDNRAARFTFQGTDKSKFQDLDKLFKKEINQVIDQAFDQDLLESVLNEYEFQFKNEKNQDLKGYTLGHMIHEYFRYKSTISLEQALDLQTAFKKLRKLFKDKQFVKSFFKKHFKDNKKSFWLLTEPDPQHAQKFEKAITKLTNQALEKKSLTWHQEQYKKYQEWTSSKEPKSITNKLKSLKLADFVKNEKAISVYKSQVKSFEMLEYPQQTNGISYINFFFDLKGIKASQLKLLPFFIKALQKTDTKNYNYLKLSKLFNFYIGEIKFKIEEHPIYDTKNIQNSNNSFRTFLKVRLSVLNENYEKSLNLLQELLTHSKFSPAQRMESVISKLKSQTKISTSERAIYLAIHLAKKPFLLNRGSFLDEIKGAAFEKYILKSKKDINKIIPEFKNMFKNIFNQKRLHLVTNSSDKETLKTSKPLLIEFYSSLPKQASANQAWFFKNQKNYNSYAIESNVQYLSESFSFKDMGLSYKGSLVVYTKYLDFHLYRLLREQGAAYGAQNSVRRDGIWTMLTYRDSNLKKSFDVFANSINLMKQELKTLNQDQLTPYILDSLKFFYKDQSIADKASFMTELHLSKLTWADHMKLKQEILKTNVKDFQKITKACEGAFLNSKKAVVGNAKKINKEFNFPKDPKKSLFP